MNATAVLTISVVVTAFLAGCTAPTGGTWPREGVVSPADANPPATPVPTEALGLSVDTERTEYLVGEPVYLTLRLENTSRQSQRVFGSLDPTDGAVDVLISTPDERQRAFVPLVEADNGAGIFVELAPGGVIGDVVPVFFGAHGWTFPNPGRYAITAVYRAPDEEGRVLEATSPPATIEVQPSPVGERLIRGEDETVVEIGKFLTWQRGDHLEQGQARLQELVQGSPQSPLASYAHAAFARSFSEPFMDYRRREVRPPDCDLAMRHLAEVDSARVPDYVRLQSALVGARCQLSVEDWDAARRYLGEAEGIIADRPEYQAFSEPVSRLDDYLDQALE